MTHRTSLAVWCSVAACAMLCCCLQACEWGLLGRGGLKRGGDSAGAKVRTEFRGEEVISRVTGRPELVFEWYRRVPFYVLSMAVTALMLGVAFAVMVVSLNLQGYIHQSAMGAKLLHFPRISVYSQSGALFDNQGGVCCLVSPSLRLLPICRVCLCDCLSNCLYVCGCTSQSPPPQPTPLV